MQHCRCHVWTMMPPPLPRVIMLQDLSGCMTPAEVCEGLGLQELRSHKWHVQSAIATNGEGLHEGLDWLESTIKAADLAVQQQQGRQRRLDQLNGFLSSLDLCSVCIPVFACLEQSTWFSHPCTGHMCPRGSTKGYYNKEREPPLLSLL